MVVSRILVPGSQHFQVASSGEEEPSPGNNNGNAFVDSVFVILSPGKRSPKKKVPFFWVKM